MSRFGRRNVAFALAVLGVLAIFGPAVVAPGSAYYQRVFTPGVLLAIGGLSKLFFLVLAATVALRNVRTFDRDNAVRPAWGLLSAGLVAYSGGQTTLVVYQLLLKVPIPFPSVADPLFVASMLLLFLSLLAFLRAYRQVGYPLTRPELLGASSLAVVLLGIGGYLLLEPVLGSGERGWALALNVVYPVTDALVLVPTVILFAITRRFRGGKVWKMWMALFLGFLALAAGDVAFAYLTTRPDPRLDALVDIMFLGAYILIARGVLLQQEMLD